ncbi:aquaporin family protein [Simonsiella muelleri]|jgi:hypothetical protein|uniref:MIP family channel protein n=1 Tax=Simonsiella muelleri ATCC 29453 TaxID=641147 RepID=U6Q2Z3_9NEIS|nr:MIP/aquaporin family protein [Simonsiella muelleri]AUX61289.1 aquaporin [Simonsiella muelleri ATCC 29453]EJZ50214.1 MIP family channel protein [Simonsiella muelleri ATCC 29453]UBQ53345.1 aquaporin family protein [Simonsiella muelleri]
MNIFLAEFIGTALLMLLGNGVVASCVLKGTKASGSGWMVITTAWAFAVFVGVTVAAPVSGAHLNPAVTLALAVKGGISWGLLPIYFAGEFLGAAFGAFLVWLMFRDHFAMTEDNGAKQACFCTSPAIRRTSSNLMSEIIGTFVLMYTILHFADGSANIAGEIAPIGLGTLGGLNVAILVWVIGLSLGSTTGYAINPARDLSPRLVMRLVQPQLNPDWQYAWIPVVGPFVGGVLAVLVSFIY